MSIGLVLFVLIFEPAVQMLNCDHSFRSFCRVEVLNVHDFSKLKSWQFSDILFTLMFENRIAGELRVNLINETINLF